MFKKIGFTAVSAMIIFAPFLTHAATLNRQLEFGMSGADVSAVQSWLAQDSSLYPQGLVTGYFGFLTKAAVSNFQSRNGIAAVGRIGPITLAAMNAQMGGVVSTNSGVPVVSNITLSKTNNSATIGWNTNEMTRGKVHYQTSFPSMTEQSDFSPATVGGAVVSNDTLSTSHYINLFGLNAGTTYYYVIESLDTGNNQTIVWPATFQTNN